MYHKFFKIFDLIVSFFLNSLGFYWEAKRCKDRWDETGSVT